MHDTDATMITSRRSNRAWVAAWRSLSISSLRHESFSMYVSTARQVRLGLVVVEVADEVLDRVLREELAELGVQLRGEGLVVGEDQRRPVGRRDDLGRGVRLARAGDAQQDLVLQALRRGPSTSLSIAWGWSPVGSNGATSFNPASRRWYRISVEPNTRSRSNLARDAGWGGGAG